MQEKQFKHLGFITAAIVATLIISNISATKLVQLGPIITDGGTLLFPLAYIFGDILTEVYGYKASRRVIYTGFFWMLVAAVSFQFVVVAPPAPEYDLQDSFAAILGQTPRILLASLIAYFAGEFTNSYVLAKMKIWTQGRTLWSRTIGSTIAGQAVDTATFLLIAFAGIFSAGTLWTAFWSTYLLKVAIEVLFTPITYRIVTWLKREEGVDVYDYNTNFNPFALNELFN
ncbi:MAG: queuosine precursor transporter [Phototrophicales bacterium]|nr:MAG: transporter [Phototrophicales bacterium]RMG70734.1 MAG: VUT family protein [Chloroflexota bacterium]